MAYTRIAVRRVLNLSAVSSLMLVLTPGCGNQTSDTIAVPDQSSGGVRKETDHSLTPKEYIRLGFPAPDKVWTSADMLEANKVLASFTNDKAVQLPRYNSPRSGEVFGRLTSLETLPSFRIRDVPIKTRLMQATDYGDGLKEIWKKYNAAFSNQKVGDAEVVELTGAFLRFLVVELRLVDEFALTLDKNDPKYAVRMRALDNLKVSLAQIVTGLLIMLTERDQYSSTELVRLLDYMQETVPSIAPRLSPDVAKDTVARLQQMEKDQRLKDLQPGLRELLAKVQNALAKRMTP